MTSQDAVIISETLARRLWPDQNPLERVLVTDWPGTYTVVGIVGDVRQTSLEGQWVPQMYLPYTQTPSGAIDLIVRSQLPTATVASTLRATLSAVDANLMSSAIRSLEDLVDRAVSPRRFLVQLIGSFSLLALVLACLGIYGVVSYTVSQRVHEIGLRMVLGASSRDICRQILTGILRVAAIGVAAGTLVAAGMVRVIAALLYDTSPYEPAVFAGTGLVLITVALAAAYVPAFRAARMDPMSALRVE
jgi:ABC-type antimicrobial peptide transport system permease subunit